MEWEAQHYEFYYLKLQVKQKFMNVITFKCVKKKNGDIDFLVGQCLCLGILSSAGHNFLQNIVSYLN